MSLYKRGGVWWLDVAHNGRRVRRSTETSDRKEATRIHDEYRAELHRIKPSGRAVYGAIEAWKQAAKRDAADLYRLEKFKKMYHDRPLHQATAESVAAVLPLTSAGTYNRYANLVCAVLALAKHPIEIARKETPPGRIRWLTKPEWATLKKHLSGHQRAMATFAINTGLRQANVLKLEWSQVDLKRRVAWIHADQTKAGKAISVPLSDDAVKVLKGQIDKHERWVFPYNGRAVSEIKRGWGKALKKANIHDFTWHGLRHTWATWHIMAGTPVEVLQKLGGWADIRMVLKYTHLDPGYLAQYANNAKPRNVSSVVTHTG